MSRPWDLPPCGAIDFHGVQRPLAHHPGGTGRRRLCWPSGSSAWLRKHLDTTPMDHLRSIRLRRVRSELLSASASTRSAMSEHAVGSPTRAVSLSNMRRLSAKRLLNLVPANKIRTSPQARNGRQYPGSRQSAGVPASSRMAAMPATVAGSLSKAHGNGHHGSMRCKTGPD